MSDGIIVIDPKKYGVFEKSEKSTIFVVPK